MSVLSPRESGIAECLADTLLAPAPPLPPVRDTDALPALDAWLARGPAVNRLGVRAALLALEAAPRLTGHRARWRTLPPPERLEILGALSQTHLRPLLEALRATLAMSYYGDPRVAALLGYEPGSVLPR